MRTVSGRPVVNQGPGEVGYCSENKELVGMNCLDVDRCELPTSCSTSLSKKHFDRDARLWLCSRVALIPTTLQ
jgi:hypothetical protein